MERTRVSLTHVPFFHSKGQIKTSVAKIRQKYSRAHLHCVAVKRTCSPSMASFRIDGVSLEACLKEKLLQSIIKMKPFIWSSGSSIRTSKDRRMARRMSVKEFLQPEQRGGCESRQLTDGTLCAGSLPSSPCCPMRRSCRVTVRFSVLRKADRVTRLLLRGG